MGTHIANAVVVGRATSRRAYASASQVSQGWVAAALPARTVAVAMAFA